MKKDAAMDRGRDPAPAAGDRERIWPAALAILLYMAGGAAAARMGGWALLAFSAAALAGLTGAALRKGRGRYYGLCLPQAPAGRLLYYLPLAAVSGVNLWFGARMNGAPLAAALYAGSMFLAGAAEEVLFRGLLFRAVAQRSLPAAVAVSGVSFGLGHLVNILQGGDPGAGLCQVCYATAMGLMLAAVLLRSGSLLPGMLAHGVFNALGAFANESALYAHLVPVSAAVTALAAGYGLYLWKGAPRARPPRRRA